MICTREGILDVANHGVYPGEAVQRYAGGATTGNHGLMFTASLGNSIEASQIVGDDDHVGINMLERPLGDLALAETFDFAHAHGDRMTFVVGRYGGYGRDFVG